MPPVARTLTATMVVTLGIMFFAGCLAVMSLAHAHTRALDVLDIIRPGLLAVIGVTAGAIGAKYLLRSRWSFVTASIGAGLLITSSAALVSTS
jgi:hypothetical protein